MVKSMVDLYARLSSYASEDTLHFATLCKHVPETNHVWQTILSEAIYYMGDMNVKK